MHHQFFFYFNYMRNSILLLFFIAPAIMLPGCASRPSSLPADATPEAATTTSIPNPSEIADTDRLKAAVFAHINKKTAGEWDKVFAITKFNSTQTAAIGTWQANDTWDWVAYKKPNNDWAVLVSLDGFKCQEIDTLTPELQNFFHDTLYRFGKKYCY